MSSMVDLKKFFESDKTNFDHLEAPKNKEGFIEDVIENNEVKDWDDLAFLEHVEPTTNEPVELDDHIIPIYPYDS